MARRKSQALQLERFRWKKTNYGRIRKAKRMIKGRKVYDPLTDTWSTGWWVADDKGNYYPVW